MVRWPFHLGVVLVSANFLIVEMSLCELTVKRIPRPLAYGLASENIFLIAAGSELAIAERRLDHQAQSQS
jgi:hypothetical protein